MWAPHAPPVAQDSLPCFSGRGAPQPTYSWTRCHRRVRVTCHASFGRRNSGSGSATGAPAGGSTRAEAYSGSVPLGYAAGPAAPAALSERQEQQQQLEEQQPQRPSLLGDDPYKPAAGRPKPLKINVDLALVGAASAPRAAQV